MSRSRHPNKEIEAAIRHGESKGWRAEPAQGHALGRFYCPYRDTACREARRCLVSIFSTPADAEAHARFIRRIVDHCTGHLK